MLDSARSDDTRHRLDRREFLTVSAGSAVGLAGCAGLFGDDRTEIASWDDLSGVRDNLDGEYALVTELDAQTEGYDEHVGEPERGWQPIGRDAEAGAGFTGTFDGRGNEIADLRVARPETDSAGLFGVNRGTIEDVVLAEPEVTGREAVGGLAGETDDGRISGASVRGGTVAGDGLVGGLVGVTARSELSVSATRETAVTGEEAVGGLVGDVVNRCKVSESFVRGAVIAGERAVGGVAGRNRFRSEITESWSAADVTGDVRVGGFLGEQDATVTGAYWDTERTDQTAGIGDGAGDVVGLTTAAMQGAAAAERMARLDFEDTWVVRTDPEGYPALR